MPYKALVVLDFLNGVFALGAPWLFGFSRNARARNTFLATGVTGVRVGLLSRTYKMPDEPTKRRSGFPSRPR